MAIVRASKARELLASVTLAALVGSGLVGCGAIQGDAPPSPLELASPDDALAVDGEEGREEHSLRPYREKQREERSHQILMGLGAPFWDELSEMEPTVDFPTSENFGSFDSWGFAFEGGYRYRVAQWGETDLNLGAEFGWMSFGERSSFRVVLPSGEVIDDDTYVSVSRFTLSGRLSFPLVGPLRAAVGGGTGLYEVLFTEESDYYWDDDELASDTEWGSYASLGLEIPLGEDVSLRVEDQIHFVQFEDLRRLFPDDDSLSGPIHALMAQIIVRL